ncbi:hypothetical protein HPB52_024825 [Rhipicephalus sanguineus]|uniref:Uncharacterized protein n=1 Tax=Rhipicephalus sanguineus TaxID=34632 RepID=A0A9D4TDV1_RHISA|nr:hypothetical protein HPB52_024825 [Rhipicephalus sanguineus]
MESATDVPQKVTEDAVNMTAAAAMAMNPPAPTNDDEHPLPTLLGCWRRRNDARKTTCRKALRQVNFKTRPLNAGQRHRGHHPLAASLPPAEVHRLVFRLRPEHNLAFVSTPDVHIALNLYSVQHPRLGQHTYPVSSYIAAPEDSCKGVIYGFDPGTSPSELMDHLITLGRHRSTGTNDGQNEHGPHYLRMTAVQTGSRSKARSRTHYKMGSQTPLIKRATHFGSHRITGDEPAFPPINRLQPAKQERRSRATPGGTSGEKLGKGAFSALTFLG